ncbi:NACHT nucleoside triphosphatase [Penicillium argentinense]|uniref:NACHT nucleoside triphosphatase n=1 Tax=Penicillium argentinense TaxID=1131581 RepID=A0A9W9FPX9_9EURO|nr:NACHT nucleoside triphosphatase [Penicillium argentinense]KAJ5104243.1 NACHT nucleoside triphosphatase [Penicillium argentinense]
MPGCNPFSGLKGKFSKKNSGQDAPKQHTQSKPETVSESPVKGSPGQSTDATLVKESATSPEHAEKGSSAQQVAPDKDRWKEAFDRMDPDKQAILKKMGFDNVNSGSMESSIKSLANEAKKKQDECEEKFWHVNVGGEKIVLREYTTSIVGWLTKAGDIAVQFAPPQASLPWDLVKSLMQIPVNESDQMGALLATAEKVIRITSRGQVYETIHLPKDPNANLSLVQSSLDGALVNMYASALDLLAESQKLLAANTGRRILEAIVNPGKATGNLAALIEQEDEIIKDVNACESQRSSDSDKLTHDMLHALDAPIARVDEGVSSLLKHVDENERIELLEWISAIEFGSHHKTIQEARTPGTGAWLLKHKDFRDWEAKRSSSLFWLQGNPGTGKTYLTSTVVDWVRDQPSKGNDEGFAFFYCGKDEKHTQPLTILQSFVRQLSTTRNNPASMQAKLQQACKEAREEGSNFRFRQCKDQILASLDIYQRTTLIIDALDECDPDTRYDLIETLQLFMAESKRVVRIFISSRPDPSIENWLESSPNVGIRADDNQGDIEKFLHSKMNRLARINTSLRDLKAEIIAKLLERCQGMFQWADMQIHQIAKYKSPADVFDRLEHLPEDLEKTYDEVWRQIESQGKYDQIFIKRALRWVMSASKPLSSVELLAAIRVGPEGDLLRKLDTVDEQGLLSICNNFLVVDPQLGVWRFPHLSVREYLEGKEDWSTAHAHYHAASVCLSYMVNMYEHDDSEFDAKLEADLKVESKAPGNTDSPLKPVESDDGFHSLHPFHIYMRHCWPHHVNGAKDVEMAKLGSLLKKFLGSPNQSSVQYRRWYPKARNDLQLHSTRRAPSSKHYLSWDVIHALEPTDAAIFAMCCFSLDSIVGDWWENEAIDISRENNRNRNLLEIAATTGSLSLCEKFVQMLVDQGTDNNTRSEFINRALLSASFGGHEKVLQMLLDRTAELNTEGQVHNVLGNALQRAASCGHVGAVQMLLDRGVDVNAGNSKEGNALRSAAMIGNEKVVQMLLDRGVHDNHPPGYLSSALEAAMMSSNPKVVQLLDDRGFAD